MRTRAWVLAAIVVALPRLASAADEADEKAKDADAKPAEPPAYGHGRQFGLRAGLVGGYGMVFRYDNSPYCHEPDFVKHPLPKDQQKFCGFGAPLAAEVAISFAPLDAIEPFLFGRFGLAHEDATDTNKLLVFGLGLRVYTMSDSAFKIFIEPAIATELEGGGDNPLWQTPGPNYNPQYKKDVVFHLAAGPQLDVYKNLGIFLDAGLTTGILRSIHSTLELQGGMQFRAP
jgi:hypothetical protein